MAIARSRSSMGGNGRRRGPAKRPRLTIPIEEAADMLQMRPRTLREHLKRTDAPCLVWIGKRCRIDCKGFYRWCRNIGFTSANI